MVIMTAPAKKKKKYSVMGYLASSFKSMMGKKSRPKPMDAPDQTVSDCDMSITQAGAGPPLREFKQFEKFEDQLKAMRDDGPRNQAIFKIDDEEE